MKKAILMFSLTALLSFGGFIHSMAQVQPEPKKDTVNIDTDAKPTFYYAEEDKKSGSESNLNGGSGTTVMIIGGAILIIAIAGYFLLRKKK